MPEHAVAITHLGKRDVARLHGALRLVVERNKVLQHARRLVEGAVSVVLGDTVLLQEVVLSVNAKSSTTPRQPTFSIRATSRVILSLSPRADLPTSCTISAKSVSFCRISLARVRRSMKPGLFCS